MKKKTTMKTWGSFDRKKGRKTALEALGKLRGLRKQMASDVSVSEIIVNHFTYALDSLEKSLGHIFPAHESAATLTGLFEEDDAPTERVA